MELAQYAKRPKINESLRRNDKKVKLICNLMSLSFNPQENFAQQFSIKFLPEIAGDNYPLKNKLLRSISNDLRGYYQPYFPAVNTLFTSAKDPEESITITHTLEGQEFKITIEKTKNYLDLTKVSTTSDENIKIKSFIEGLIKNIIGANNELVRFDDGSVYNYQKISKLQGSAYIMPGFSTSAMITQRGLFLKVYPRNKFMTGKTAYEKLVFLKEKYVNGSFIVQAKEYFQGISVLAKYGSYRVYRISDIAEDKNCLNTVIQVRDIEGKMKDITLDEYYQTQYKITIKDKKQLLLIHKTKIEGLEVIYLIPELCYLSGIDDEMRERDRDLLKNSGTRMTPNQKMRNIGEFKDLLTNKEKKKRKHKLNSKEITSQSPNDIGKEWGLEGKDFCRLEGREISTPRLQFNGEEGTVEKGKIRYKKCLNSNKGFGKSDWICLTSKENDDKARGMIDSLKAASKSLNILVEMPKIYHFYGHEVNVWMDNLTDIDFNNGKKLVFVVLESRKKNYYSALKSYFVYQIGIPSQFVLVENKSKNLSYYTNVLNQMTVKTGGELFNIMLDEQINIKHRTMIIGLDSSRHGSNGRKYYMTSSYNQYLSKYFTQEGKASSLEECSNILGYLFRSALNEFNKRVTKFPEYVIIYRAGGNDKQKKRLFQEELPSLKNILAEPEFTLGNLSIKLCYITVNKKTEVKFFQEQGPNLSNPENGTVIDTDVVHPDNYDFYLQPQFVSGQCTATPVHYQCMHDDIGIPLEILEKITYGMTYYYWNWSGPIREPAALKFAEVCNSFSSKILKQNSTSDKLKGTPYYI